MGFDELYKNLKPAEAITLKEKTVKISSADSKILGEALVKHTIGASPKAAKEFTPNAMITGSTELNRILGKNTFAEAIKIGV